MLRGPSRISKRLLVLATLSAACLLGPPRAALANLEIWLSQDSGPGLTLVSLPAPDFGNANFTGSFGNFALEITGAASDNGASLSDLLGSTASLHNTDSSASHTIHVWVIQSNYTLPSGPILNLESGMTFNTIPGSTVGLTGVFQAYFDPTNFSGPGVPTSGTIPPPGALTSGSQNAFPVVGQLFSTNSLTGTFNRPNTMYALLSVANITLSAGGTMNFSNHISVTGAPEPTTMLSALLGIGLTAGLARLRRRRAVA